MEDIKLYIYFSFFWSFSSSTISILDITQNYKTSVNLAHQTWIVFNPSLFAQQKAFVKI